MKKEPKKTKEIGFEEMMRSLSEEFEEIKDKRRANAKYKLGDILRSAFAMFSLKSPSLLSFQEQSEQERQNLKSVDHFNFSHKVSSSEDGIYSSFLPPGKYKVQVNACGFVSAISEVEFKPQEKTNLEITLLVSNDSTIAEIGIYIGNDANTDLAAPTEVPKVEPTPKFRPYLKHKKN